MPETKVEREQGKIATVEPTPKVERHGSTRTLDLGGRLILYINHADIAAFDAPRPTDVAARVRAALESGRFDGYGFEEERQFLRAFLVRAESKLRIGSSSPGTRRRRGK